MYELFTIGLVFHCQDSCWYLVMDLSFRVPYITYCSATLVMIRFSLLFQGITLFRLRVC